MHIRPAGFQHRLYLFSTKNGKKQPSGMGGGSVETVLDTQKYEDLSWDLQNPCTKARRGHMCLYVQTGRSLGNHRPASLAELVSSPSERHSLKK